MKIVVLGAGWYGCHIALHLHNAGHEVVLREREADLFQGASGCNPARLHLGFHYPRSLLTRAACREHFMEFMSQYGSMTRHVPVNIYAVAAHESMIDFGTYLQVMRGEAGYIIVQNPAEFGLENVDGAIQTGERHIVINEAREYFRHALGDILQFNQRQVVADAPADTWIIDCTFCSNDAVNIDRFEPCVTALLEGPTDKAVTIMDGPFPSLYPWDESQSLNSLTSASLTPLTKTCRTWPEARLILDNATPGALWIRCQEMIDQMAKFYPAVQGYKLVDMRTAIRAMPKSAADTRLVDVVKVGERQLRVRAGKIDAILQAAKIVEALLQHD